ncbi:MAG TPA: hypothetical protein VFP10_06250 [Candidatus Eisenbacteria bacterium]|nr:hypothetical protein [Candidatus Eisenbacteria bacterium]
MASQPKFQAADGQPGTPEVEASRGRRFLHLLISLAGWVLFVYWWILVFRRVTPQEIRFTLIFLAVAGVVIVAVTAFWVFHNKSLFRKRNARVKPVESESSVKQDAIGRRIRFADSRDALVDSAIVRVQMDTREKVYHHGPLELV